MPGTVIITGATGHLGQAFVALFLASYPEHTLVATARDTSNNNPSTANLNRIIAKHTNAKIQLEQVDLARLDAVRSFTTRISSAVSSGALPRISALVCNAFTWSLNGQKSTPDGFETCFQVGHLSHHLMVLRLLGSMDAESGRVVMLGSDAHDKGNPNPLSKLRAEFPVEMEGVVKPPADAPGLEHDRGFQRYGTAKLANVTFMMDLNKRLQADPYLSKITATAMDPGGLVGSGAHTEQKTAVRAIFGILSALMPILRHVTSSLRTSTDSARDLLAVAVGDEFEGRRGYYILQKPHTPAAESADAEAQKRLWDACWRWAGMSADETVLENASP